MALRYEYDNPNKEYTGGGSRYQILRVIDNGLHKYLETYNKVLIPEVSSDVYHIVSQNEANRLDIIANHYYGTPSYWWALAIANNLIDPFIVNEGTMLRVPSLQSLSSLSNEILTRRGGPF